MTPPEGRPVLTERRWTLKHSGGGNIKISRPNGQRGFTTQEEVEVCPVAELEQLRAEREALREYARRATEALREVQQVSDDEDYERCPSCWAKGRIRYKNGYALPAERVVHANDCTLFAVLSDPLAATLTTKESGE